MARLKVGVAERVITPPVGVPLGGYAGRPGPSVGVHDDLHARALVLEAGGERAALVSLELLYPTPELVKVVREEAERRAGVPADSVLVAAVHTHSGPSVFGLDPCLERGYLDEYWSLLPGLAASAVAEAAGRLAEASVRFGRGRLDGWTVNRRRPGLGPLDNEVGALLLEGVGSPVAAVVNFACHAVVLGHNNLLISADYPGAVSRAVKRLLGATALFLTGACGDVNPLTPGTSLERVYDRSVGTFADVEEMGTAVACEAVKSLMGSRREEEVELRAVRREVKLSVQPVPEVKPEEVAGLEEELRRALARGDEALASQLRFKLGVARWALEVSRRVRGRAPGGELATEVQAVRLGSAAIVALPGEPFVEVGLAIKSGSPARLTMVAGYSNDAIGYVPTDSAFDEGGYETAFPACIVGRGSAQRLVESALEALKRLFA
ncbi:MAG: neutral/alkaline non-lysosomal ceramidase N-terminal domain-containing protein [Thermofilum sp.]|nr:neutral/alkaline non-lysosomal ceramidase N-terminal domain-containing protein [Thermofilum sp.]